ncbi:MAG TPA: glycoside hydrolase family 31 protein [Armatimonadota bacterium]|jgi:alpha-glucosidase
MPGTHGDSLPIGAAIRAEPGADGLTVFTKNGTVAVTFISDDVVRIRVLREGQSEPDASWAILPREGAGTKVLVEDDADSLTVRSSFLSVRIARSGGSVTVASGVHILLEAAAFSWESGKPVLRWTQPAERNYYGCGEKSGPLERRGAPMAFWNAEECGYAPGFDPMYHSIPFTLAMDGPLAHGLFVDNTFRQDWRLGELGDTQASIQVEGGALDLYLIATGEPKSVLTRWTDLVGRCPLPPLWALGYHQSRWSYYPESAVRELAANFRSRNIPCDVIWFDIDYMEDYKDFTWHPTRFPDPAKLLSDLKADGFRSVVMLDPGVKVQRGYAVYDSLLATGLFVRNADGTPFVGSVWPGPCLFPDFTNPATRAWWGEQFPSLLAYGIDGFWNDMNEPAVFDSDTHTMPDDVVFDGDGFPDTHLRYHNVYAMDMVRATSEALAKYRSEERSFVLTRAGYAGAHRFAATWTGDNRSDWPSLAISLPMIMNLGISGHGISGPDIGGFVGEPTPELFGRWLQANALFPFCRVHSAKPNWEDPDAPGGAPQEPWAFGEDWEHINRESIGLRYRLLPYLYTLVEEMTRTGFPVIRPLLLEYPDDPDCRNRDTQYLVGRDLLVAPVLTEGDTTRTLYLPAGLWYDFWTEEALDGGREITVGAPLDRLPLFVRAGAAIPTQPFVQHTGECTGVPIEWRVYLGDGAEGTLYEDDGHSRRYLDGDFSRCQLNVEIKDGQAIVKTVCSGTFISPRPAPRVRIINGALVRRPSA